MRKSVLTHLDCIYCVERACQLSSTQQQLFMESDSITASDIVKNDTPCTASRMDLGENCFHLDSLVAMWVDILSSVGDWKC